MLAATDWTEIGGICALVAVLLTAGAYGGKGMNMMRLAKEKRKATATASNQDILDQIAVIKTQGDEVKIALKGRDPTTFEPQPPPGLMGTLEQHMADDAERWDAISGQLTVLHEGQKHAAKEAATEVVKQVEERERVQKRDAAQ